MTSVVPRSLDHTLTDASDVAEASQLVVDHLTAAGIAKPSVYLARGDRLRIQAVEGYQQVFDGMPVGVGVIGRAYTTGEEFVVDDVLADDGYLRANPSVRAEACFPLSCCGRLVGALNVESLEPLSAAAIDEIRAAARSLEVAFLRLGHVLRESPAQRLVRHALRLGALTEPADIHAEVVAAAIDVADMASAALLLPGQRGRFRVVDADGLLAGVLDGVSPDAIQAIASARAERLLVLHGRRHDRDRRGARRPARRGRPGGHRRPAQHGPGGRGVLLLADERPLVPGTQTVELVELLAAHAASSLRTAGALEELRDRAATDPLTGLGHHGTFHEAFSRARARREAIGVVIADIDGFKAINDARGHQAGDRALRETAAALGTALRRGDELFRIGGDEFAAIVRVADGHEALELGRRLRAAVNAIGDVTISIGVALPVAGESHEATLARADQALYDVKAAGRDGVALLT
jgi:diguanylate cyclase (GGDEF)-like protein